MKPSQLYRSVAAIVFTCTALAAGACGKEKSNGFGEQQGGFNGDAGVEASDCRFTCSLDGRSVIQSCTGEVVTTCAPEQACGAALCQAPCAAAAADRSSNGCEFYFQSPRVVKNEPQSCHAAFIVNTSAQAVDLTLELEGQALDIGHALFYTQPGSPTLYPKEGPIQPGESVVLFVSDRNPAVPLTQSEAFSYIGCPKGAKAATLEDPVPDGSGIGSAFRMSSTSPVSVTSMYPFGGALSYVPSATLLLPVAAWAKENIVVNGWEASVTGYPSAQIVASEDDTEITIVPSTDLRPAAGIPSGLAHVPVTIKIDKGQFLQLVQSSELSGSIVTSTKPTSVFGGQSCALVPSNAEGACDTMSQQLPAYQQWGSEYAAVGYRPRTGNENEQMPYRVVAARDGTRLDYDPTIPPGAPTELAAGEVATFPAGVGDAFTVRTQDSEHPLYVAAYMSANAGHYNGNPAFGGRGDPEFVNVVPAGQYLNSYSFYADPTYAETSLVVIRAKTMGSDPKFEDVWLECAGTLTGWKPIGTRGQYEWLRIDLTKDYRPGTTFEAGVCQSGLQRMKSEGPFTATLWGWDRFASYAAPGGMAQRKLVTQPLPPVR
ncbi:hypothetical protein AKJ09_01474 [Labilithrix luteola]|uniref:IgGFc-binding protein N-terminal domain-containing protein n=1 Tax=Labilithrix luteola TaxID=1391654 RepID=A0A0K1PMQ0_9BACT|nr:IgGFc-binding protein [Labilithrix luteola]AKU94810.1 hypothetical protein AKJ09_01474 [Labilithrix luteola]